METVEVTDLTVMIFGDHAELVFDVLNHLVGLDVEVIKVERTLVLF